ncbi:MAG: metal-dependent transcriptional regulator [Thermodesulfobacteriota bacterium]|nr:metal-dependent transcriptional regulator [Thermodesulfobacteriota bacterium]
MDLTKSLEDYLETILLLSKHKDGVRVKDVAEKLGVKKPSVVSAVRSLVDKGLLDHEHYGVLVLTPEGEDAAKGVYESHKVLFEFLCRILGVEAGVANNDACLIEHCISPETKEQLIKFLEFVNLSSEQGVEAPWLENFRTFMESGEVHFCWDEDKNVSDIRDKGDKEKERP